MTKPITPVTDIMGDNYLVDAVLDGNVADLPDLVSSNLRHLLMASELGDLVVIQCTRTDCGASAYVLCARVLSTNNISKLLPICELENNNALMSRMRPPRALNNNAFVKPTYSGSYITTVVEDIEGQLHLAQLPCDDNVH